MLPLKQYIKIKNRYCISYLGPADEYLLLLSYIRPAIEAELPGIEIYLCGRDDALPPGDRIIAISDFKKEEMAFVKELTCDLRKHPVEELIRESALTLSHWKPPTINRSHGAKYVICPNGKFPTKSLTPQQIETAKIRTYAEVNNNIDGANWVIGVENEQLFKAAMQGIRTTLIPTGLGTNLYKKLFPSGEIMVL